MTVAIFLLILFFIGIELYAFQSIKLFISSKKILRIYIVLTAIVFVYVIICIFRFDKTVGQTLEFMYGTGILLLNFFPKLVISVFLLFEDIYRFGKKFFYIINKKDKNLQPLNSRRKFISQIGMGVAAVPFLSLIYGTLIGRYNFKVIYQDIFFPDLPDDFNAFTITHISDLHCGSFDNKEKIEYAMDLINQQNSDMIVMTGDLVNSKAPELYPWIDTLNKISTHKYGKYAILGNHDYGEYVTWNSQKEKEDNLQEVKDNFEKINFKLLLNEQVVIQKENSKIHLVGVENNSFNFVRRVIRRGDLKKASENLTDKDFKILLSHDSSHWEHEVKKDSKHFQLTLSGHTHGMQFGIEIPGHFKWSPVQYIYKQWAGLYRHFGRYIYVNRGFGFHAYPGRIGIMPEITVIRLNKGK